MDEQIGIRRGQLTFQALLLIISLVLFWEAFKIEGVGSISGSGIFPMAAASVLIITLVVRLLADWRTLRRQQDAGRVVQEGFFVDVLPVRVLLFIALAVAFVAAMGQFGFWAPTGIFLAVSFAWLFTRNPLKVALVTGGALAFIYLVFAFIFKVYLP
jgi:putative tricarboxylic transport membrane protein